MTHDAHGREKNLDNNLEKLKGRDFSDSTFEAIKDFVNSQFSEGRSTARVCRHISSFNALCPHIDFDLRDADKRDVQDLITKINRDRIGDQEHSPWTLNEYRKTVKKFYQDLKDEENPEIVEFISTYVKKKNRSKTNPEDLPTPKQVEKIKDACYNCRDRAFLAVMYESGGRFGEVIRLKWKDIKHFEKLSKVVFEYSKTMPRTVPVKDCVRELQEWKSEHPNPSPESYVFTHLKQDKPLTYSGIYRQVQRASRCAEVNCDTNFHAFRKARATYMASNGMNTHYLMRWGGWTKPKTTMKYVRLAHRDLEDEFLRIYREEESNSSERHRVAVSSPPSQFT